MRKVKTLTADELIKEQISQINADELLKKNIYDYGIDVIEDRALADYRDGFKPAQRRILQSAKDLKAYADSKTVKSARVTGDCMGKYHPHGSAYGSLVTLVNSDYPVLDGQGNYGDINNGPAAERYTEVRISEIGMKCLECMAVADTVPNYGGDLQEPIVITSRFPTFFVNDCEGIAVGIKSHFPAHNLEEIVAALKVAVKKGESMSVNDIVKHVKGPDFAYGGKLISPPAEVYALYANGKGALQYECEYTIVPDGRNWLLTITGYCPNFTPMTFINKMTDLIKDKNSGVVYVNDSSTKDEPCKLEVILKSKEYFDLRIKKMLTKTVNYHFYTIERHKSTAIDKDVVVDVLEPTMLELLLNWVDWRKEVETKMTQRELNLNLEREVRLRTKLSATENLNVVKDALESNDPVKHVLQHLPYIVQLNKTNSDLAKICAEYLMDQKLNAIRKLDAKKLNDDIAECVKRQNELNEDLSDISKVVIRELDKLKKFYKPRKLKIEN